MKFDKSPKDALCEQWGPGDGQDPRWDGAGRKQVINRKALQLCAQVADTLNVMLPGCADACLRNAYVESVVPAPDSQHLLVTVVTAEQSGTGEALQRACGRMRNEIAEAIHRKKVPQLRFNCRVVHAPL